MTHKHTGQIKQDHNKRSKQSLTLFVNNKAVWLFLTIETPQPEADKRQSNRQLYLHEQLSAF
ncbi:hypothetical protein, partial [Marinomonas arenicola]